MTVSEPVFSRREIQFGAWALALVATAVVAGSIMVGGVSAPPSGAYAPTPGVAEAQPYTEAG